MAEKTDFEKHADEVIRTALAMQPCGERQSRIPLRFMRATLLLIQ